MPMLPRCSRSPSWVIAAVLAWSAAGALLFVSPLFPMDLLKGIQVASHGWITVTLVASALIGGIGLAIILTAGRQRLRDVGLRREDLLPAALATALLWLLTQASSLLAAGVEGPGLAPPWSSGAGLALGPLLAQLLGTALMEEATFRGWLWPQLTGWLRANWNPRIALPAGLLLSQLAFAVLHIPVLAYRGMDGGAMAGTLLMLFLAGLYFALLYALTRNLLFAVGAHALGNATTPLLVPAGPEPTLVLAAGAVALAVIWRLLARSKAARPPQAVEAGANST